jgi:hypothetical protein
MPLSSSILGIFGHNLLRGGWRPTKARNLDAFRMGLGFCTLF